MYFGERMPKIRDNLLPNSAENMYVSKLSSFTYSGNVLVTISLAKLRKMRREDIALLIMEELGKS